MNALGGLQGPSIAQVHHGRDPGETDDLKEVGGGERDDAGVVKGGRGWRRSSLWTPELPPGRPELLLTLIVLVVGLSKSLQAPVATHLHVFLVVERVLGALLEVVLKDCGVVRRPWPWAERVWRVPGERRGLAVEARRPTVIGISLHLDP